MHGKCFRRGQYIEKLESRTLLTVPEPNNSLATAFQITTAPFGGSLSFTDTISLPDSVDLYKIRADASGTFRITLRNLAADLNMSLIQDKNGNNIEDPGELVATSAKTGTADESITAKRILISPVDNYFVKVFRTLLVSSAYAIDISFDTAGDTGSTARLISGVNGAFGRSVIREGVSLTDTVDVFSLTLDPRVSSATFAGELDAPTGSRYHLDIFRDTDSDGVLDSGELLTTFENAGGPITLSSGARYYLRLLRSAPATENYTLKTLFDYAGNSIALARNVNGIDDIVQTFSDQSGDSPGFSTLDGSDFYRFTVSSPQTLFLELSLLDTGFVSSTLDGAVIQDKNKNGLIDAGEQLVSTGTITGSGVRSLSLALPVAGDAQATFPSVYYVKVVGTRPTANYQLALHGDLTPGIKAGGSFSSSRNIGTVTGRQLVTGALGAGDDSDTFQLTLPFPGTLSAKLSTFGSTAVIGQLNADTNGDGLFSPGDLSVLFDKSSPLSQTLSAGTYFVTIAGKTLSYDLTITPDFAGDTQQAARNMGTLGSFAQASDHVTAPAADIDFYKFAINGTQTFTGSASAGVNLTLTLIDQSAGTIVSQVTGADGFTLLQRTLTAGTYFLLVASATADADYTVGFSTGDNDDSIPESLLSKKNQMIVGDTRDFTLGDSSDVDMILVNLDRTGDTAFAVDVDSRNGSNVDTFLRLFDPNGNQLAFNDNGAAPGEAASKFSFATFTVPPNFNSDFVFVGISASANKNYNATTGAGDSGGASSGQYFVTITRFTPTTPGSISGSVYNDLDGDGAKDANETGLAGRTVFIDLDNDSVLDANEKSAVTNASGQYTLAGLGTGTYKVRQIRPAGWSQTFPLNNFGLNVTLVAGQNSSNNNFFIRATSAGGGSISGTVFHDFNRNGALESGDSGLNGFTVYLDLDNDSILDANEARVLTDASGNYVFNNLAAGTYKIRIVRPAGFVQTTPTNNFGNNATLSAGQHVTGKNFGADN